MDKLKEIYETMLNGAAGKGFTVTCNKCDAVSNTLYEEVSGPVEFIIDAEEDEESSGSLGSFAIKCNKCKQYIEMDENHNYKK